MCVTLEHSQYLIIILIFYLLQLIFISFPIEENSVLLTYEVKWEVCDMIMDKVRLLGYWALSEEMKLI